LNLVKFIGKWTGTETRNFSFIIVATVWSQLCVCVRARVRVCPWAISSRFTQMPERKGGWRRIRILKTQRRNCWKHLCSSVFVDTANVSCLPNTGGWSVDEGHGHVTHFSYEGISKSFRTESITE